MIGQTLKQYFGFDSLRTGQEKVITDVLNGDSAAAIFPTGSGKSLCYQLPALHLPHLTLVISPLLALIKDQVDFLQSKGIAAASVDSTQNRQEIQKIMQQARTGELKILMISVERLKNERFRQFIFQVPISLLVVDEAHCISEWGHNFRPDYLKLPNYRNSLNIPQVLLLTATATQEVIEDMSAKFNIDRSKVTVTGFYRSNLELDVIPCNDEEKTSKLHELMQSDCFAPTIVYVTLQKSAEQVAQSLQRAGINAEAYHAGLPSDDRESIQRRFMQGVTPCIVATIAFGMGIDKANIRRVIHFDLPKSIENYSQEIGRAGRDGLRSECIILANTNGLNILENFVYGDAPEKSSIAYVVEQVLAADGEWEVMLNKLSRDSNIRQLPLKTLLVYLELHQILQSRYSYFADYRFKLIKSTEEIIHQFSGERRSFVEAIFHCSKKARTWYSLDFEALGMAYSADRKRVVAAIDYFYEQGWIELESKQITDVYKVTDSSVDKQELVDSIYQLFLQKERNEIKRIHLMVEFFQSRHCLSHSLAGYFSDNKAPEHCGHCSVCKGKIARLTGAELPAIDTELLIKWISPYKQAGDIELSSKAITRYLCGITTPHSTKIKASKMEGFGKLEAYPFAQVEERVNHVIENTAR